MISHFEMYSQAGSASATYSAGDISTDHPFSTTDADQVSTCSAELVVTIPVDKIITGVDVSYDMTAASDGWMIEQRSRISITNPGGGTESGPSTGYFAGSGITAGTFNYSRTGLIIGESVTGGGVITFRMDALRTWEGNTGTGICGTLDNKVDNNSWTVTVYYDDPPSCARPTNLAGVVLSSDSAELSWTPGDVESLWDIELVDITAQDSATGTPTVTGVTNPYIVSGLNAGNEYQIFVRADCGANGVSDWTGPFAWAQNVPPDNDECENAIVLTVNSDLDCGVVTAGTTEFATASANPTTGLSGTANNDVWYSFTATGPAHRISLINLVYLSGTYSSTDMGMGLYNAAGGCEGMTFIGTSDPETWNVSGLTSGDTYYVRVYGWDFTLSNINFDICVGTPPPPPANDACEDATVVGSLPYNISQDASAATNNDGFISTCAGGMNDGVWYTFTVETAGTINISISDVVGWDPEIALYSGACGAFTCVASEDSGAIGGGESISTAVTAGTQYWLNIGYFSGFTNSSEGPFTLDMSSADVTLDVEGFEVNSAFTFYPNPVKNTLTLNAQNNIEQVTVFNMLGQAVIKTAVNSNNVELDMSNLGSGTYFAQVTVNGFIKTVKVLKD